MYVPTPGHGSPFLTLDFLMQLSSTSPVRYRVERSLGQGGLGEVFLAFDLRLKRHVALKRLSDPEGVVVEGSPHERAWREAVYLAAVQHPNVVTVYDFGSDAFGPFVIMELVHGETLDAVVSRGAFPLADFRILARQTLEGLAAAHHAGLLHRDLKPANIMLKYGPTQNLQVKILDFGIARFSPELDPSVNSAMMAPPSRTVLGTVEFMAPEQFEHQPLTQRGELYSLGCIFYYALTGHDPFRGGNTEEIIVSHLSGQPADIAGLRQDLPGNLCAWVMRLLQRQPEDRPRSVQEALSELLVLEIRPPSSG